MHCTKRITDELIWVGGNDRRLAMFEGVYSVPCGVSYNAYLMLDEQTVLFDTVDKAVEKVFMENLTYALNGRTLDYVVVQHMEPDHSASLAAVLTKYPEAIVVCNDKIAKMIDRFFGVDVTERAYIVKEGDFLRTGRHEFTFVMAPMVHWPEVMVTYDKTTGTLFSADAFGSFGALNGAIFADEIDVNAGYMDEARRYYCNIVGKYGPQVQALFKKAASLDIRMLCPLHGYVWRRDLGVIMDKYQAWSSYTPEEKGVMIAYASIYGNTENAADILAAELCERGVRVAMYDVSVTPASEIIAAAFRYSHLVFASATYNAGVFVSMDELLRDLAAHNIQNRTVALIENGSWAPTAAKQMKEILASCKNITFLDDTVTVPSAVKSESRAAIEAMAEKLAETAGGCKPAACVEVACGEIDPAAFFKLSYGLFVLSAKEGAKDNGCIINTAELVTDQPKRITVAVNNTGYTHDMIKRTGTFNISVLGESASFDLFKRFGFVSGKDTDKFEGLAGVERGENGVVYLTENTTAMISAKVIEAVEYDTHTVFFGEVTEAKTLSSEASVTYAYYHANIKPKKQVAEKKTGYVCRICGYVYEGEELPADFICPLCKHGAEDFEKIV